MMWILQHNQQELSTLSIGLYCFIGDGNVKSRTLNSKNILIKTEKFFIIFEDNSAVKLQSIFSKNLRKQEVVRLTLSTIQGSSASAELTCLT